VEGNLCKNVKEKGQKKEWRKRRHNVVSLACVVSLIGEEKA
jgi:hypothetical protein